MDSKSNPPTAALRTWRASIIRKKLNRIGRVYATERATAEAVAVKEFGVDEHERPRLLIEEVR